MIRIKLVGGKDKSAEVNRHNALKVSDSIPEILEVGTPNRYRYFSGLLGQGGLDKGVTDMSTTSNTYFVEASPDFDYRIMYIIVLCADAGADHNAWGNIGATSIGIDLFVTENGESDFIIEKATTFGQALVQTGMFNYHTGGSTSQAFQFQNWADSQEAQTVIIPIKEIIPGGLRIGRGTKDRLTLNTNDNFTGVDEMFCRVIGYKHYP